MHRPINPFNKHDVEAAREELDEIAADRIAHEHKLDLEEIEAEIEEIISTTLSDIDNNDQ